MKRLMPAVWKRTENRLAVYSLLFFLIYAVAFLYELLAEAGVHGTDFIPIGVDFGVYYTAGYMTINQNAGKIFDVWQHHETMIQLLHQPLSLLLPWFYPPFFLLVVVPFSFLPFRVALVLWLAGTLVLAFLAARRMLPERKQLASLFLGFPGVLMNLRWGQNGFLSAALLGFGIAFLESNPIVSGAMFGLLAYKPQFATLPFLILLLTKNKKALFSGLCSAAAASLVSLLLFGAEPWAAFFRSLFDSSSTLLETDQASLAAVQTAPFNALLNLGLSRPVSYALQGIISLATVLAVWWIWTHTNRQTCKGASLVLGIPLSIPYFMQYDLVILALPLILLSYEVLQSGCRKYESALLLLLWLMPAVNWPLVYNTGVQLCPLVLAALLVLVILRVKKEAQIPPISLKEAA